MASKRAAPPRNDDAAALEALLDQIEDAFEAEDPGRALELADKALAVAPESVDALHYRAAALTASGDFDAAHEGYARALEHAPEDLDVLHGAIELLVLDLSDEREALEDALDLLKRAVRLARRRGEKKSLVEFLLLEGIALDKLGEAHRALPVLQQAAELAPDDPQIALEQGVALFELCRFEDAARQLKRAMGLDREEPWAHHYLGLIAERRGDLRAARRSFEEARRLSPEEFPEPVELSQQEFDEAVEDALAGLPPRVRGYLTNVSIGVEDLPSDDDLLAADPPLSPTILGLFHGTPITEKSVSDPWSHFPSAIVLYQRNLQRFAKAREELIEQIGITLIHEVGHFLGLSELDLYQRGLD